MKNKLEELSLMTTLDEKVTNTIYGGACCNPSLGSFENPGPIRRKFGNPPVNFPGQGKDGPNEDGIFLNGNGKSFKNNSVILTLPEQSNGKACGC